MREFTLGYFSSRDFVAKYTDSEGETENNITQYKRAENLEFGVWKERGMHFNW